MKLFFLSLVSLFAVNAFAESALLDADALRSCGGRVELRYAENGDLALKFTGAFNKYKCPNLRFLDASSGRVLKEYDVNGTSYTLSQKMRDSLSADCRLKAQFDNGYYTTQFIVVKLNWCVPVNAQPSYPKSPYSYELSGSNNCKLMKYGQYTNQNVEDFYCAILGGKKKTQVAYEFSNSGNCKIMINGVFQQHLGFADKFYCKAQH
jgi:hypothetical protein